MYRLSEELATKVMSLSKNIDVPELSLESEENPFKLRSTNSLGYIDPVCALGTECAYVLEVPYSFVVSATTTVKASLNGYWLYRREELEAVDDPNMTLPRHVLDPNVPAADQERVDISSCCVRLPSDIDKLTCPMLTTIEQLLAKEPALMDCLNL